MSTTWKVPTGDGWVDAAVEAVTHAQPGDVIEAETELVANNVGAMLRSPWAPTGVTVRLATPDGAAA